MTGKRVFGLSSAAGDRELRFSRVQVVASVTTHENPDQVLTVRLPVDHNGNALLPDDLKSDIVIRDARVESQQGEILQRLDIRETPLSRLTEQGGGDFFLDPKVIDLLRPRQPTPPSRWSRAGKFLVLGKPDFRFDGYELFVYAATEDNVQRLSTALDLGADAHQGWVLPVAKDHHQHLAGRPFQKAHIGFDGRFAVDLPLTVGVTGWVWLLSGPKLAVGFRPDNPGMEKVAELAILLPSTFEPPGDEGRQPVAPGELGAVPRTAPPLDADEQEIIDHAEMFSDDPGPFCKPFRNPERILGERRFSTILRVDQPQIAAAAGIRLEQITERLERSVEDFPLLSESGRELTLEGIGSRNRRPLSELLASPLGTAQRRGGRKVPSSTVLVDWEGDTAGNQAVSVARGHILEWRVRWRSNGYSLGNVAHTLTLAPRQTKRIMKVDFERRERASRRESLQLEDEVDQSTVSTRDYEDAVSASLAEWSRGSSRSSMTGAAAGAGFAMPGFVVGGGVTHGSAKSSSSASGEKNISSAERQNLRDAIRQHGESIRNLESTVITELAQEESVEAVSETIANPNFCHSLTVVYYDILRHLRVDTELGGVSECLFVPFAITPFHETFKIAGRGEVRVPLVDRLIRYRDVFRRYLKDRNLRWVLTYLDDYKNNFRDVNGTETVPDGPRSAQKITRLSGELYIKLDIRSPLRGDEDDTALERLADQAASAGRRLAAIGKTIGRLFTPFAPIMGVGVSTAASVLAAVSAEKREKEFYRTIAPDMARNFVDRLTLSAGEDVELQADFTLDDSYRAGGRHRVYFSVSQAGLASADLSRDAISTLILKPRATLPLHSVANVVEARIRFATSHYTKSAATGRMADDLLVTPAVVVAPADGDPGTVSAAPEAASLGFPTTFWEQQDLRQEIRKAVVRLTEHIDSHLHYYHKAIWWSMDHDELYTLLDGYVISESNNRSIASVVERRPLAILGNTLVFRVARGASISDDPDETLEDLFNRYQEKGRRSDPMRISLPTGGLYAQALMDECDACEEHYGSTDWILERDEIVPQELDSGLLASRRSEPANLVPTGMPDALINIQNAPTAPAPAGFQGVFSTLSNPGNFRDMAGLAGTQANAAASMQAAKDLATRFGSMAAKNMDANVAAIKRAKHKEDAGQLPPGTTVEQRRALEDATTGGQRSVVNDVVERTLPKNAGSGKPVKITARESDGNGTREVDISPPPEPLPDQGAGETSPVSTRCEPDDKLASKVYLPLPARDDPNTRLVAEIYFGTRCPGGEQAPETYLQPDDLEVIRALRLADSFHAQKWRLVARADARGDRTGRNARLNQELSERRIQAVENTLLWSGGQRLFPANRITTEALGDSASDPSNPDAFPYDRVVEVYAANISAPSAGTGIGALPVTRQQAGNLNDASLSADEKQIELGRLKYYDIRLNLFVDLIEQGHNDPPTSADPLAGKVREIMQGQWAYDQVRAWIRSVESNNPAVGSSSASSATNFAAIARHMLRMRQDIYYRTLYINRYEGRDTSSKPWFDDIDDPESYDFYPKFDDLPASYQAALVAEGLDGSYLGGRDHLNHVWHTYTRYLGYRSGFRDLLQDFPDLDDR
jgi:hypothetical protein